MSLESRDFPRILSMA